MFDLIEKHGILINIFLNTSIPNTVVFMIPRYRENPSSLFLCYYN